MQRLEAGNVSLDESLSLFEEGIGLAKYCSARLDAAEGISNSNGGFERGEPKLADLGRKRLNGYGSKSIVESLV